MNGEKGDLEEKFRGTFFGAGTFLIIIWPFYGLHLPEFLQASSALRHGGQNTPNIGAFVSMMSLESLGITLSVLSLAGLCAWLYKGRNDHNRGLLALGVISSLVFLYIFPIKENRYFLPVAALGAPLAAGWIFSIKNCWARGGIITAITYLCLCSWIGWMPVLSPVSSFVSRGPTAGIFRMRPAPRQEGFGDAALSCCAARLSRGEPFILVTVSPEIPFGSYVSYRLPVYLRYDQGIPV